MTLFPCLFFLNPHHAATAVRIAHTAPTTDPATVAMPVVLLSWPPSFGVVPLVVGLDVGGCCARDSDRAGEEVLVHSGREELEVASMLCDSVLDNTPSATMNNSPLLIYNVLERSTESCRDPSHKQKCNPLSGIGKLWSEWASQTKFPGSTTKSLFGTSSKLYPLFFLDRQGGHSY